MNMSKVCLLIAFLLIFSCGRIVEDKLLPEKYILEFLESFNTILMDVNVYSVSSNEFNIDSISQFPLNYDPSCSLQKWNPLDYSNGSLLDIILEENEFAESKLLSEFISKIEDGNEVILFSCCYTPMRDVSGDTIKFYEQISLWDIENRRIYHFYYRNDPF